MPVNFNVKFDEIIDKFNSRFIPEPMTGCWLWNGCLNSHNYGAIRHLGKTISAHRMSYRLFKGEFNNNLHVLHKCDTPQCVNPDHLFLGTQKDNSRDMINKKRGLNNLGSLHPCAKTDEATVKMIRKEYELDPHINKFTVSKLSEKYNLTYNIVYGIIKRRLWKHI